MRSEHVKLSGVPECLSPVGAINLGHKNDGMMDSSPFPLCPILALVFQAAQELARSAVRGEIAVEDIDEAALSKCIQTQGMRAPSIFLRHPSLLVFH